MIDISKAFDKINYDILISKILKTSLPKQIVYMLEFMFKNTYVNTSINKVASEPWRVENGTRQGGINSPILFSFYINDTINAISNMNVGCSLGGIRTNIICYADDVCLLAPTAVALQKLIDVASVQLENIRLDVNVSKCACMVFSKRNSYKATPRIMLNNQIIDRVSEFKYLGVIISEDLNINSDINRVSTAFLKQFYSMYSKFYNLNNNVLHHLFRTYTSSFYGIETWYDSLSNRNINKLSVCYHKAVKKVAHLNVWDSNHLACDIVNVPIFIHLAAKRAICFLFSLLNSQSPCVHLLDFILNIARILSLHCLHILMQNTIFADYLITHYVH